MQQVEDRMKLQKVLGLNSTQSISSIRSTQSASNNSSTKSGRAGSHRPLNSNDLLQLLKEK